jgi:hypothetical protein
MHAVDNANVISMVSVNFLTSEVHAKVLTRASGMKLSYKCLIYHMSVYVTDAAYCVDI